MALPESDVTWPPAPYNKIQDEMKTWNAWYTGDTDALASIYGSSQAAQSGLAQNGIIGSMRGLMWGRPQNASQSKSRLHLPIAADIARTSSDLLFAEAPTFIVGKGKSVTQDRMADMFGNATTASELLEGGEIQSALGGTYVRLIWDTELFDYIRLDTVDADAAVPEWRRGVLQAVTFWSHMSGGAKDSQYRFLERHAPGYIEYALYKGTDRTIGRRVPLQEHPDSAWAAALVNQEGLSETGVKRMTVKYVPNVLPNRKYRQIPELARLGRSDFDQLPPLMDAADEAYSSMMRDLRLGKARAFVDSVALQNNGPGQGASFDMDQELYAGLSGLGSIKDGGFVQVEQPEIRYAAHKAIVQDILSHILRTAGYSSASFGDDPNLAQMTATEINSRRELSNTTRSKKMQYWKAALEPLARTALELQAHVYGTDGIVVEDVSVRFPAQSNVNPQVMASTLTQLNAAGAISTERKVRMLNANWDSDDVNDEVRKIKAELSLGETVVDPTTIKE